MRTVCSRRAVTCAGVTSGAVRPVSGGAVLTLRVSPGAKSTGIRGFYGEDALKLSVAAPPAGGRANAEAERYLAALIGVSRSGVEVVRGACGRDKVVLVRGVSPDDVRERIPGSV